MTMSLIHAFTAVTPLPQKEIEAFIEITSDQKLRKGELWIKENKRNERVAFLLNGYLRKYYVDNEGKEVTDYFYFQGDFCADLPSIIGGTTPSSNVIAMEETSLTTFSYSDLDKLRTAFPRFERIYAKFLEQAFLRFYNRANSLIQHTPKQRYDELIRLSPMVLQRATQYHIASYLGISYQHLSRLRSGK